jgi:serine protease Do
MSIAKQRTLSLLAIVAGAVIFGMVVAGSLNWTPQSAADKSAPPAPRAEARSVAIPSFADIADRALDSVVSITSTEIVKGSSGMPFIHPFGSQDPFQFFFGPQPRNPQQPQEHKEEAGGSGFIISSDGYVLTNNHVIADADKIKVKLRDQELLDAKVVGKDAATDIALLKIDAKEKLRPIALGDSNKLRVGDWVMAIGNPMNFEGTVTVGVCSAKGRTGLTDDPNAASFENFIQTDAAINFGNSGGPLINVNGEVVGINTAIFRPAQNIGFAVPINTAKSVLPQLKERGKVVRGFLGIRIRNVDQDLMNAFHLPSMEGAFVESVEAGEPAEKAGIQHGDTIVKVDDLAVHDTRDLISYVSSKGPGTKVKIDLIRNGKTMTVTVTLAEREAENENQTAPASSEGGAPEKLGITITNLTPDIRQQLKINPGVTGVVVEDVKEVSPAADQGLAEGDVITEINGAKVSSVDQFKRELDRVKKGDYLRLYVRRFYPQEFSRFVVIKADW